MNTLTLRRILRKIILLILIASLHYTLSWGQSNQNTLNAAGASQGEINGYRYEFSLGELFVPMSLGGTSSIMITPGVIQPFSQSPLPVTLINFDGKLVESYVSLTWASSLERNSAHFEVQRSKDARTWHGIGQINAKGESQGIAHYFFSDLLPLERIGYYRLKTVDLDASYAYSRIISVDRGGTSLAERSLVLYPNPFQRYVTLSTDSGISIQEVRIFDAAGRSVFRKKLLGDTQLDLNQLQSGAYWLEAVPVSGAAVVRSLIKQ